jgi:hypothetical protein
VYASTEAWMSPSQRKEIIDSPIAVPIMAMALPYWMTSFVSFFMLRNYADLERQEKTFYPLPK